MIAIALDSFLREVSTPWPVRGEQQRGSIMGDIILLVEVARGNQTAQNRFLKELLGPIVARLVGSESRIPQARRDEMMETLSNRVLEKLFQEEKFREFYGRSRLCIGYVWLRPVR